MNEILLGNYEVVSEAPDIISPIGVISKPDGGVRLIYDCSLPKGQAVNDYCTTDWYQKFSRVEDAASYRAMLYGKSQFEISISLGPD